MEHLAVLGYIDPMSGSIVLQVVLAGILACFALFRNQLRRVFGWLSGRKSESSRESAVRVVEPQPESQQHLRKAA